MDYKDQNDFTKLIPNQVQSSENIDLSQDRYFNPIDYDKQIKKCIEENDLDSLSNCIFHFSKNLYDKSKQFSLSFNEYELISNTILHIFDPVQYPQLLYISLPLLENWVCKQNKTNDIFAQQSIHDYLLSLILDHKSNPNFNYFNDSNRNYRNDAINTLYNIIFDSQKMLEIFICSNSTDRIADFFQYIVNHNDDATNDEIIQMRNSLPDLMMLMNLVIQKTFQFQDSIEKGIFDKFIAKSLFRFIDHRERNVTKFDCYVFSNYITQNYQNFRLFMENVDFKVIFDRLDLYENINLQNILSVLLDIFIETERYNDEEIKFKLIPLNFEHLYKNILIHYNNNNTEYDEKAKLKERLLFLNFLFHYFKLFKGPVDKSFNKDVFIYLCESLSNKMYKIRKSAVYAFESLTSANPVNNERLREFIKPNFFSLLNNFLDCDSVELIESILKIMLNLLQTHDDNEVSKKIFNDMDWAESFQQIEEILYFEDLTSDAKNCCDLIFQIRSEKANDINYMIDLDYISMTEEEDFDGMTPEENLDYGTYYTYNQNAYL